MSDLRDKLLKAGLVSEEQAKASEAQKQSEGQRPRGRQEGRQEGRSEGRQGDRQGQGDRQERRPQGGGNQGRRDGRRQEPRADVVPVIPTTELSGDEVKRLVQLAKAGRVELKGRLHRRWYYVSRKGELPWIDVSEEVAKDLEARELAICETPRGDAWVVDADTANALLGADARWIRAASVSEG
jgi:hypothetical protein